MKNFILMGICVALLSTTARAEEMYISDIVKITLRTGPGTDHRVIALVQSGMAAEIFETSEDWTRIRLDNGKEGWVLSRFLTPETPKALMLEQTQEKYKALSIQVARLVDENTKLKEDHKRLELESAQDKKTIKELNHSYETLKAASSQFLAIKSKYEKSVSDLDEQRKKTNRLEAEQKKMGEKQNIKWFLTGAGVLFFGFLIGFSTKRQRRKSSLL